MSFKEYNRVDEQVLYENGVYISVSADSKTQQKLKQYCNAYGIELTDSLHITLIYSQAPLNTQPLLKNYRVNTAVKGFSLFGLKEDVLVIKIDSPKLIGRNAKLIQENGFISDWDEYEPHMTLQWGYKGDISKLPEIDFPITVELETVENLDPSWAS